ncbi:unnamed protein product, partial [Prorocentrum cordatum]
GSAGSDEAGPLANVGSGALEAKECPKGPGKEEKRRRQSRCPSRKAGLPGERQPGGPGRRRRACRRAPPGAQRRAYGRAAQRGCGQKDWRGRRSRGGAGGGGEEEKKEEEERRSRDELRQARTLRDGAAVKTGGAKSSNRAELRGENPEQRGEGGMQRPTCTGPQTARKQRTSTRTRTGTRQGKGN